MNYRITPLLLIFFSSLAFSQNPPANEIPPDVTQELLEADPQDPKKALRAIDTFIRNPTEGLELMEALVPGVSDRIKVKNDEKENAKKLPESPTPPAPQTAPE